MGSSEPYAGPCEAPGGVDPNSGPGIRVLKCHKPGVEHRFGWAGVVLCPEHCAALARSDRYVTSWEVGHCGGEPAPPADRP